MISIEIIKEFQEAIQEEYGKAISAEDANTILSDLIAYFNVLAKIQNQCSFEEKML
jgi:hypothetical protein